MDKRPDRLYQVKFQQWDKLWCLTGPVGSNGRLLFHSAQDAASHAKWDARDDGGKLEVYTDKGELFKVIELKPSEGASSQFVMPTTEKVADLR